MIRIRRPGVARPSEQQSRVWRDEIDQVDVRGWRRRQGISDEIVKAHSRDLFYRLNVVPIVVPPCDRVKIFPRGEAFPECACEEQGLKIKQVSRSHGGLHAVRWLAIRELRHRLND